MAWLTLDHFIWGLAAISVIGIAINAPVFFWSGAGEHVQYQRWSGRINLVLNLAIIAWAIVFSMSMPSLLNNSVPTAG